MFTRTFFNKSATNQSPFRNVSLGKILSLLGKRREIKEKTKVNPNLGLSIRIYVFQTINNKKNKIKGFERLYDRRRGHSTRRLK